MSSRTYPHKFAQSRQTFAHPMLYTDAEEAIDCSQGQSQMPVEPA